MSFGGFWKGVGKGLAVTAKGLAKGAVWASTHPEVLNAVAGLAAVAGAPAGVTTVLGDVATIEQSAQK